MQPWVTVERARAPDGVELELVRRGEEWVVRAGGRVLMTSRAHASEEALAAAALGRAPPPRTILLGGLGLGFTLRAALDRLPPDARVIVAELVPALVAWNRGPLAPLAGRPLEDPRVRLQQGDVLPRIAEARGAYQAILLDVDNGPQAVAHPANDRLYGEAGVAACAAALSTGGVLAVWSAAEDPAYLRRLGRHGLTPEAVPAPTRPGAAARHVLLLGRKDPPRRPRR